MDWEKNTHTVGIEITQLDSADIFQ